MVIKRINHDFTVCKVPSYSGVDIESEYSFIGKTDEEISLVCITDFVPDNAAERDDRWKAIRKQATLDISLIGILSKILTLLADNKIGIFAISTYNTDYILTKKENFEKAITVLSDAGYQVVE